MATAEYKKGHSAVFGIFDTKGEMERSIDILKIQGFRNSDISVLMPTPESAPNFGHEKNTKAPEGAATGATGGMAIGGAVGWLVGVGAIMIPGIGPFLAAGPIVTALAAAGVGGAVGGVAGALVGWGIPEYEAKVYDEIVRGGGILVSVHVDDSEWLSRAKRILEQSGARDVSSAPEVRGEDADQFQVDPKTKPLDPFITTPFI